MNSVFKAKKVISYILLALLFSCSRGTVDPIDMNTGLRKSDFDAKIIRDRYKGKEVKNTQTKDAPIPTISSLALAPPQPIVEKNDFVSGRTISFFVTDQISLKDVLIELGRVAKIDVDIDPNITGGVVISARNRPLGEIIDRIATLGSLRYEYKNGILRFERDTPYMKNYFVDYLTEGSDLWTEVSSNVNIILDNHPAPSSKDSDLTITPIQKSTITVNKAAGILSAFATQKQHDKIKKYLKDVEIQASAQVLIEAKVVEVKLNDEYKTGIDWSATGGGTDFNRFNIGTTNGYATGSALDLVIGSNSIYSSISALEKFGTTRTLSSPRVHAINNKKATLTFGNKLVYFKVEAEQSTTASTSSVTTTTITSTKVEENVGVELTITPSIRLETNEITLNIKPKITVKSDSVVDPASPVDANGDIITKNEVPVIQTREIETIAKIQSGNIIVVGGLMSEVTKNEDTGIPYLQRIPILGNLFKSTSKTSEVVETVILIKATIVNSASQTEKVDREIEKTFDTNRRNFF